MIRDWRGRGMLGRKERNQLQLFITGSLRQLIPDDHVLARVDRVLDLTCCEMRSRINIASRMVGPVLTPKRQSA
jgi:hypothetical protein